MNALSYFTRTAHKFQGCLCLISKEQCHSLSTISSHGGADICRVNPHYNSNRHFSIANVSRRDTKKNFTQLTGIQARYGSCIPDICKTATETLGFGVAIKQPLSFVLTSRHFHSDSCSPISQCFKCGADLTIDKYLPSEDWHPAVGFFCPSCKALQPPASTNHFQVFGLKEEYDIDTKELTRRYRMIQQLLHPDRAIHMSQEERAYTEEQSALVNKAYDSLLKPLQRALYLLELQGHSLEESDMQLEPGLLMEVMEINEQISECSDEEELRRIFKDIKVRIDNFMNKFSETYRSGDIIGAKYLIAEIKYFVNIENKIKERIYEY